MQRVVYNSCFGGFGLHEDVVTWVRENVDRLREEYEVSDVDEIASATISGELYDDGSGPKAAHYNDVADFELSRDNELMADVVAGETAYSGRVSGDHSSLQVAEVPDGVEWTIDEYDGRETVKEQTRTFS